MLRQPDCSRTSCKGQVPKSGCLFNTHSKFIRLHRATSRTIAFAASATEAFLSSLVPGRRNDGQLASDGNKPDAPRQPDSAAHAAALSRTLGLAQPRLMSMVERCPALFSFTPEALGATVGALAELTGLQTFQVPQLLWVDPELLLQPDRLKANMRGVAQALGVPLSEVANMAAREPCVLALGGGQVEDRMGTLGRLLRPPEAARRPDDLVAAVLRNPGALLLPEPAIIEAQMQALNAALEAVIGGEEEAAEDLQQRKREHGAAAGSAAREAAAGGAPSVGRLVGALVVAKPSLLSTPPQLLAGRVVHLAGKAGMTPREVLAAAISGPDLLAASSCYIDRHCTTLAAALGPAGGCPGGESEAAAILVSAPELLAVNVGSLSAKWLLLAAVFKAGGEGWERRLATAGVAQRARLLALPHARLVRLRFLADTGLQGDVDPLEALALPDALFLGRHPQFRAWQAAA